MPTDSSDPSAIRSIAVTAEDVVAAAETNRTSDRTAVLRITPPFSGRMRARLHVLQGETEDTDAIHLDPAQLLADDAPAYPNPNETEDRLRADPETEYTVERHREYHERAVDEWREDTVAAIRSSVMLSTAEGEHEIAVTALGGS